jgi:transposase-like protein
MTKLLDVEKDLSEWRKSKNGHRGRAIPEQLRMQAVELLSEYSANYVQKELGINSTSLKRWQKQYESPEDFFIHIPNVAEKARKNTIKEKLTIKISRGEWSVEGNLSMKEWESAMRLLEGVKR